ncbi:hypothetical protein ACFL4T_06135 [candidate division KSB1 bacterium]
MRYFKKTYLILLTLLLSNIVFAQKNVSIETEVDKNEITIGDLINYSFTITASEDAEIKTPPLGINLGMFEIRDYKMHDPEKDNGTWIFKSEYTITTYDTGSYKIPSLPILYKFPSDTAENILYTDAVNIKVISVKPSEAEDILDIKDPLDLKQKLRTIFIIAALFFILILGSAIYYYFRKKKGKDLLKIFKEPELPPDEKAIKELNELAESGLLEEGKIKEYYIRLSEIVREYFEGRFFFPSLEKTTYETIQGLEENEVKKDVVNLSEKFLVNADIVKFAKHIPAEKEIEKDFRLAEKIIERTRLYYKAEEIKTENLEKVETEKTEEIRTEDNE